MLDWTVIAQGIDGIEPNASFTIETENGYKFEVLAEHGTGEESITIKTVSPGTFSLSFENLSESFVTYRAVTQRYDEIVFQIEIDLFGFEEASGIKVIMYKIGCRPFLSVMS